MRAITIWQPWASLIIAGAKPFEWRPWAAPSWLIGERIVIHAGARKVKLDEVEDILDRLDDPDRAGALIADKARELLQPVMAGAVRLPTGAALGTAILGRPRRGTELLAEGVITASPFEQIREDIWGWPLSDIEAWPEPPMVGGAQGFWIYHHTPAGMRAVPADRPAAEGKRARAAREAAERQPGLWQPSESEVPY